MNTTTPTTSETPQSLFTADPYYHPERHIAQLEKCQSFKEVGVILLDVLKEMHETNPGETIYQVCGPITSGSGDPQGNLEILEFVILQQRALGKMVFNQLPAERALARLWHEWKACNEPERYCYELLDQVYFPLFNSRLIRTLIFLPNWKLSTGASWENHAAKILGIQRCYLTEVPTLAQVV